MTYSERAYAGPDITGRTYPAEPYGRETFGEVA